MKNKRKSGIVVIAAVFAAGLIYAIGPAPESALVKIEKREVAKMPAALLADLHGVQELDSCWIILASDSLLADLAGRGIVFDILDVSPEDKAYFLVFTSPSAPADRLRAFGEVRLLDAATALFWSGNREAREILPAEYGLKWISIEDRFPVARPVRRRGESGLAKTLRSYARTSADLIPQMVGLVSKANLTKNIQDLQNFQTRYASTTACENSGTSIFQYFTAFPALQTAYDPFTFGGTRSTRNIIAVLPGQSAASQVVILCAHYDSYSSQAATNAPGADDNGSGTAAVMEIARVLSSYAFDFTLKFIGFSAEEWGLYGSKHYVQEAKAAGETILGVINMDMIGYENVPPEDVDIVVNGASEWLGDRYIAAAQRYAPLPTLKIISASFRGSDHSPFWDQGYAALCGIEDAGVPNPYYHKTTDTLSTLNMDFVTAVTKASLALAADLAQPIATLPAPAGLEARSQVLGSLFSSSKTVALTWRATSALAAGYNVYRATTTRGSYEKANPALLTTTAFTDRLLQAGVSYYYVVTAVDAQGRESNFSAEVRDDAGNRIP